MSFDVRSSIKFVGILAPLIFIGGIGAIIGIESKFRSEMSEAKSRFYQESDDSANDVGRKLEMSMRQLYQGLRTIARLPGVKKVDRYGKNFEGDSRWTVQEIYNNLVSNVGISEVYLVPVDFDPEKIDPVTKKKQVPISTFDSFIVNRNGDQTHENEDSELPEIEDYEFAMMKKQLDWYSARFPYETFVNGLIYPSISSPEVITCDNSRYKPSAPNDKDRSGIIISVPFFGDNGELKGMVSGVILTSVLTDMLPNGNFGLLNRGHGLSASSSKQGTFKENEELAKIGQPMKSSIYSKVIRLRLPDAQFRWELWACAPNSDFYDRKDVQTARTFRIAAIAVVLFIMIGLILFVVEKQRSMNKLMALNKNLEEQVIDRTANLMRARKMEAIGELAAGIAHEINTPTQFIGDNLRFLEIAQKSIRNVLDNHYILAAKVKAGTTEVRDGLDAEELIRKNRIEQVCREVPGAIQDGLEGVSRIAHIVGAMKHFAHPGMREAVQSDINRIIESSAVVTRNEWKNYAVVETELFPSLPQVTCNPGEIGQTVVNLIVNAAHAIKANPNSAGKGKIIVKSEHLGDRVAISVTDNGCGMTPETKERVFDQFFTTKEAGSGTGMGLAITKSVIDRHQGTIEVTSKVGEGTTFRIELPISQGDLLEEQEAA